jgi:tetratricopeptide (TPR) repeat protein
MAIHTNQSSALANIVLVNGHIEEAMKRWERVRDECRRVEGEEHRSTLRLSYWIAGCLRRLQRLQEAEILIRVVMKTQGRVLGEDSDDDDVLFSYQVLADILRDQGTTKEAAKILKRLLALSERKYGQGHRGTLGIKSSLAANLFIQRRYSEAEILSANILPLAKEELGEDDDITLDTLGILSDLYKKQGRWPEAENILLELVTLKTTKYGKEHPSTSHSRSNLALCLMHKGSLDETQRILQDTIETQSKILGNGHPNTVQSRQRLESVIRKQGLLSIPTRVTEDDLKVTGQSGYRKTTVSLYNQLFLYY